CPEIPAKPARHARSRESFFQDLEFFESESKRSHRALDRCTRPNFGDCTDCRPIAGHQFSSTELPIQSQRFDWGDGHILGLELSQSEPGSRASRLYLKHGRALLHASPFGKALHWRDLRLRQFVVAPEWH